MDRHSGAAGYRAVRRPEDGEHVGYLLVDACEPPCVIPCDLLGIPLAGAMREADAERLLVLDGLAAVAEPFEALLPPVLGADVDPTAAQPGWTWRRVLVIEVGPSRAVLRPENPAPAEAGCTVEVAIPADELLHRARPRR